MKKNNELLFCNRFHEYIISSKTLPSNGCKYKICQVKQDNDSSKYLDVTSSNAFVKEPRFSYIRPVNGATRLIVYNCSNITGLEQIVHRGSKVVVEVPDGCMIAFINYTIHAGVKSYEKQGGMSSSHLRMFAYIVEQDYVQITYCITKLLIDDKRIFSCATCASLINEKIHYEGHVIRYLKSQCEIDKLSMESVFVGNLENISWFVLQCDYAITANSKEQNYIYHLNNYSFKQKNIVGIKYITQIVKCFTILMRMNMNKNLFKIWTFEII